MARRSLPGAALAQEAVNRAVAFAEERKLPLTLERLAVELEMEIAEIRRLSDAGYTPSRGEKALCNVLRRARREVQASVTEYGLQRGTGAAAVVQYLTQMAPPGGEAPAAVVFLNEDKVQV